MEAAKNRAGVGGWTPNEDGAASPREANFS